MEMVENGAVQTPLWILYSRYSDPMHRRQDMILCSLTLCNLLSPAACQELY